MKNLLAAAILCSATAATSANLPLKIHYQGRLIDPVTSVPQNGLVAMTFRLYDSPSGGTARYTESQSNISVSNGVFSVQIGSAATLSPDLFSGASAYLSVQVSGDSEMSPRQQLLMSPYAFSAGQLVGDASLRVRAGTAYSTFTSAGNFSVPAGVVAGTGTFSGTGNSVYAVTASSGIISQEGTVYSQGSGGVSSRYGVKAASLTAVEFLQGHSQATPPAVSVTGTLRAYYDSTEDGWMLSQAGRAYSMLGNRNIHFWSTTGTAGVANQGLNLPLALTEFDSAVQGTRMLIDCDELPAQLALRYNFRSLAATSLTIGMSIRDVSNTANILVSASQAVNAVQNYLGQSSYVAKPSWCAGTQTVAIYTDGGNGAADYIFKHLILVGRP